MIPRSRSATGPGSEQAGTRTGCHTGTERVVVARVEFRAIERAAGAFQGGVGPADLAAMCRRAFGPAVGVTAAVELGGGMYNTTYRVELATGPVILRVGPEPHRQYRLERGLMRNEYASVPYLAPIADLMPRTLAADFTHQLIDRDYLFQTHLP